MSEKSYCAGCQEAYDPQDLDANEECQDCHTCCQGCGEPGKNITWYDGLRCCTDCAWDEGSDEPE